MQRNRWSALSTLLVLIVGCALPRPICAVAGCTLPPIVICGGDSGTPCSGADAAMEDDRLTADGWWSADAQSDGDAHVSPEADVLVPDAPDADAVDVVPPPDVPDVITVDNVDVVPPDVRDVVVVDASDVVDVVPPPDVPSDVRPAGETTYTLTYVAPATDGGTTQVLTGAHMVIRDPLDATRYIPVVCLNSSDSDRSTMVMTATNTLVCVMARYEEQWEANTTFLVTLPDGGTYVRTTRTLIPGSSSCMEYPGVHWTYTPNADGGTSSPCTSDCPAAGGNVWTLRGCWGT